MDQAKIARQAQGGGLAEPDEAALLMACAKAFDKGQAADHVFS